MLRISMALYGIHGGFTRSGGNFRKNNWAKGRLDVGRILTREPLAETRFRRPRYLTKHGFPSRSGSMGSAISQHDKYCNMSILHEQNARTYGMSVSERSALDSSRIAMVQSIARK